jgi:hypothetical protein
MGWGKDRMWGNGEGGEEREGGEEDCDAKLRTLHSAPRTLHSSPRYNEPRDLCGGVEWQN